MRDMLFVSHANPEDSEFARWISLQLANEGYGVWCDLTKLLGGERFWDDIQAAIRERTARFLYVLSKTSNVKDSPRDELELALKVRRSNSGLGDFIIPVWIDDLASGDFYVRLQNLNAIRFQEGWRRGLDSLLQKLEKDSVPKREGFGPGAVRSWWRTFRDPRFAVREVPEMLLTNWHPVAPAEYYVHDLERSDQSDPGPISVPATLPHPGVAHNQYLVSFAPPADLQAHLGGLRIQTTRQLRLTGSLNGDTEGFWKRREKVAAVTQLLNQAWQQMITLKDLPTFEFSNARCAFYFKLGTAPEDKVVYLDPGGKKHWRNVVGTAAQGKNPDGTLRLRYWHFGLHAKAVVSPRLGYVVKPHVLFSDDGLTIWNSTTRLHRARRSQCKRWWNDKWRDLLLGTMAWLADGGDSIRLPVGREATISVSARPLHFDSPFSYDEGEVDQLLNPEEVDLDLDEGLLDEDADQQDEDNDDVGDEKDDREE